MIHEIESMEYKRAYIGDILSSAEYRGDEIKATFVKKNGDLRDIRFVPGLTGPVKGTGQEQAATTRENNPNLRHVFDIDLDEWRMLNIDTVKSLTVLAAQYEFIDGHAPQVIFDDVTKVQDAKDDLLEIHGKAISYAADVTLTFFVGFVLVMFYLMATH